MGGGLMQLVAYGAQDIYLTGNPQITFFKVVYRRHTNFSMEAIEQTWNGSEGVVTGAARATATISRNGDLVHRMYLEISGQGPNSGQANPTSAAIVDVELEIGGQKIDKHTGKWMNTWAHLTEPNPSAYTGDVSIVNATGTNFQNMSGMGGGDCAASAASVYFVPLYFWFCRNPGLALPLIALQYHEVKVILNTDFSTGGDLGVRWESVTHNKLWCDYIYLDTDERRRFAQVSHEYLIEQVQEQTIAPTGGASSDLNFNHPVKELIFTPDAIDVSNPLGTGTATLQLKLNGHDRFAARNWRYFSRTQIWEHHTGCGGLTAAATKVSGALNDSIGVYSFALKPEEHQPSGTCNFSRIDNAQLTGVGTVNATICYAVNYNVLRIMSGMGGLAYSN
jgi:hypothetical protein